MKKVFIVDDESYILKNLCTLINWSSYYFEEPFTFKSARKAISEIENNCPDLIISDIKMPGMNGIEFAETIHNRYPHIKFVILSAYQDFNFAVKALKFNVIRYLIKPISISELEDTLQKINSKSTEYPAPRKTSDIVLDYMDSNLSNASLKEISQELGISQNHLSMIFHKETGKTFSKMLSDKKMATASKLIENGVNEKQAAESVGYVDINSFRKTLAEYMKDNL